MSNKTNTKSDFTEFDNRVGQAWSLNFRRQFTEAIEQFRRLVEEWPDHVDANYGMGLALKAAGQKDKAREYFNKCLTTVVTDLSKGMPDPARYTMLRRIIEQQIESLK